LPALALIACHFKRSLRKGQRCPALHSLSIMPRFIPAAALAALASGCALCCSVYGNRISLAPSAAAAAPYVAPFTLFAVGAGTSVALCAAALCDAAAASSRRRSS
jgi:hypothetical protein